MAGLYAADGSLNVSVVSGSSITGRYAADGSLNVVIATGTVPCGINHPCGAIWVTLMTSGPKGVFAPDGSLYVKVSPYTYSGGWKVTAVSGSLTSGVYRMTANNTSYVVSGTAASLKRTLIFTASATSYAVAASDTSFVYTFPFTAPLLDYIGADPTTDTTPSLSATFYESIIGYDIRLVASQVAGAGTPYTEDATNTIDAGEDAALLAAFTTGELAGGLTYFKCRIEQSGIAKSDWSNVVSFTITSGSGVGLTTVGLFPFIYSSGAAVVDGNTAGVFPYNYNKATP